MGVARKTIRLLLDEGKLRPFHGALLQLGRQTIQFTRDQLHAWAHLAEYPLRACPRMDDVSVFGDLGFDDVQSLDVSDYEHATIIHDLNQPISFAANDQAFSPLFNRFDLILDGGTMEHVFDQRQALANIHHLLRVGGRIIHANPASNYIDHGFYSFSPTLWLDYYTANQYKIHACYLLGWNGNNDGETVVFRYEPGCLDVLQFGGFTPERFHGLTMWDLWFVAEKTAESTSGVIPQQGLMRRTWEGTKATKGQLVFQGVL